MRFIFKMLVLVGMILVGKFLKEDATRKVVKTEEISAGGTYSMSTQESYSLTQHAEKTNRSIH